jgi:hypothetical protein
VSRGFYTKIFPAYVSRQGIFYLGRKRGVIEEEKRRKRDGCFLGLEDFRASRALFRQAKVTKN